MKILPPIAQLKRALLIVWLVISAITFLTIVLPFVLPEAAITRITPECEWKVKYRKSCALCGMTGGFIHIARGEFAQASDANGFSPYLFALFGFNQLLVLTYLGSNLPSFYHYLRRRHDANT